MQSFYISAGVKAVPSGTGEFNFVPLDQPEAEDSDHPPMFVFINRRSKGIKVWAKQIKVKK